MIDLLNNITLLQITTCLMIVAITLIVTEYYKLVKSFELSVKTNHELDETIEKVNAEKKQLLSRVRLLEETNDKLENSLDNLKTENNNLNYNVDQLKSEIAIINSGSRSATKNSRNRERKPQSNRQS